MKKKKANQKQGSSPDGQEGRGLQHNDHWSPKDNNGISEGLGTRRGSGWPHLICHQKENQSTTEPEDKDLLLTEEPPINAPPVEIGQDDLDLEPTPGDDPNELILEPAVDHLGRRLDPAAEGIGEPDPLILAKSPATLRSTTQLLIPGPRERAQAQDQDAVLSVVKDWVRQRVMPERLELDFGDIQLKAYVKVMPVLRLCQLPDLDNLDILVKTDIQGGRQSERYCMLEKLIDPFIKDLHLRLTHYGVETMVLTMKHLVWFPSMWTRVQTSPPSMSRMHPKTQPTTGQEGSRMLLPKGERQCGQLRTSRSGRPTPSDTRRIQVYSGNTM